MIAEVNPAEFQANVSDLLSRVRTSHNAVLISEQGQPVAALVDAETYARILANAWKEFDEIRDRISAAFANVPEEEGMAEIERLCREVRSEMLRTLDV